MTSKEAIAKAINEIENEWGWEGIKERMYEIMQPIIKDLELLDWLIEKMYVAGGLIELKVCPPNNPTILIYLKDLDILHQFLVKKMKLKLFTQNL